MTAVESPSDTVLAVGTFRDGWWWRYSDTRGWDSLQEPDKWIGVVGSLADKEHILYQMRRVPFVAYKSDIRRHTPRRLQCSVRRRKKRTV